VAEWQVAWTAAAVSDLGDLVDYIAQDDPVAALAAMKRLRGRAAALCSHPQRGRIVPELREAGALHYRELLERPWRILYRIEGQRVLVLAVLDSRRDLQTLLLERLIRR
jgi:plasmid stabilization system protein ParE